MFLSSDTGTGWQLGQLSTAVHIVPVYNDHCQQCFTISCFLGFGACTGDSKYLYTVCSCLPILAIADSLDS